MKKYKMTCPSCNKKVEIPSGTLDDIAEHLEAENVLKIQEKDQLIASLGLQLKNLYKKIEVGSQQAQGEAMELLIQEFLAKNFTQDTIKEVPKGVKGADCLQIVSTPERYNMGSILYEIKRTQSWSNNWVPKLKEDLLQSGAMFAIIVTETMPPDLHAMGQLDGIWVCTRYEVKALTTVLREAIILYGTAVATANHSDEEAHQLYTYLTSPEFKQRVTIVLENFVELQHELVKEKRAMEAVWKRREVTLNKIVSGTSELYGTMKAIMGNNLPDIKQIELQNPE